MLIAQIIGGAVAHTATAPTAPGWDNDSRRWLDYTDPAIMAAWMAAGGWQKVTEADRPADTNTTTSDLSYRLSPGPVQVWTVRPWTPAELAAKAAAVAQAAHEVAVQARVQSLPDDMPRIEAQQEAIVDALASGFGVTL